MKKKGFSIFLFIVLIGIIGAYFIVISKYNNIGKTIDKKIETKKSDISKKEEEIKTKEEENKNKKLQEENMDKYIETLETKVKEYEK